jgi:predicted DNA-binding transcriptional regulator YafY
MDSMTTTASRMLQLLALLQSQRIWPGQALAERLHVTSRTVRRDVDRLRDLGYCIGSIEGPDGGYRLEAGADLPPCSSMTTRQSLSQSPCSTSRRVASTLRTQR